MTQSPILSCEDLREITGYQRPASIVRCLRDQGVQVFYGRHGPWTTIDLINMAGGLGAQPKTDDLDPQNIL